MQIISVAGGIIWMCRRITDDFLGKELKNFEGLSFGRVDLV